MALSRFILPFADVGSGIRPSANSQMFFYATGTTTPKDTFNCPDGTTANSNPVVSDINGLFPDIFVTGTYKVVLQDKNGDQQWEADPVTSALESELNVIARSLNVEDGQVIYSSNTTTVLDDVLYIYDSIAQVTWGKPLTVGAGEVIVSVVDDLLTTDVTSYQMIRRVFMGDLSDYDGGLSWLGQSTDVAPNGSLQPNLGYIESNSSSASYASTGAIGFSAAAHSEEMTSGAAIGLIGAAVNDNEINSVNVWGLYIDAKGYANSIGAVFGQEVAIANLGVFVDEYSVSSRKTTGTLYAAGADPAINGTTEDCTQAIRFTSNGSKWGVGLTFGAGSLRTFTDAGSEGFLKAIVLRNSMQIGWESTIGDNLGFFRSSATLTAEATSITLGNNDVRVGAFDNSHIAKFTHIGSGAYVELQNRDSGASPVVMASGDSANLSLKLQAKGTGTIDFGGTNIFEAAMVPANFTADSILTVKINGVNYKIAVRTGAW